MARRAVFVVFVVLALLVGVYGINAMLQPRPTAPDPAAAYVTLIGYTSVYDGKHFDTVDLKDVPSGRWPFHVVAVVAEGTRVQLIDHDENDALVVAPNGTRGYVSLIFVRELCGNDCP